MNNQLINKKLIEKQMELLNHIYDFCIENNLRISLGYGTLLGAVRHKGYIPWDKDIDVIMPLKDYKKLLKIYDNSNSKFYLQTYQNDKHDPLTFARLKNSNTTFIIPECRNSKQNLGIWIDIFPYSPSSNYKLLRFFQYKLLSLRYHIAIKRLHCNSIFDKIIKLFFTHTFVINLLDSLIPILGLGSNYVADFSVNVITAKVRIPDPFRDFIPLVFENNNYQCIKNYDNYLKANYGNYMQIPSKEAIEAEESLKNDSIIDFEKSYKYYQNN